MRVPVFTNSHTVCSLCKWANMVPLIICITFLSLFLFLYLISAFHTFMLFSVFSILYPTSYARILLYNMSFLITPFKMMLLHGQSTFLLFLALAIDLIRKHSVLKTFYFCVSNKIFKHSQHDEVLPSFQSQEPETKPYEFPPLKLGSSAKLNMGLSKFEGDNWLTIDDQYNSEHTLRSKHLSEALPSVVQCLAGSEHACQEVLLEVSSFLAFRYPRLFTFTGDGLGRMIHNLRTGESFSVNNHKRPLEAAARLAMEDFNVLYKDPGDDEYRLKASATLFPAGWRLEERIGSTLAVLHDPVPGWEQTVKPYVMR
jgi:hypothetical protein